MFVDARGRSQLKAALIATRKARRARDEAAAAGTSGPANVRDTRQLLDALLIDDTATEIDLGRLLDRCVSLIQLGSRFVHFAATSLPAIRLDADVALTIASAVRELVHALECAAARVGPVSLYLAAEWDGSELTIALASPEAAAAPVPSGSGAAAIVRAELLASLVGGSFAHGVRDGRTLFGLAFGWPDRSVVAH